MIPKRTWTAGPNNKNEQPTRGGPLPVHIILPPDLWAVRDGHLHSAIVLYVLEPGLPRTLHPAPCSLRISQLTRLRAPGIVGRE